MRKERKRERIRQREWPRGFEADWDMHARAATRKQAHQSATCRGCKAPPIGIGYCSQVTSMTEGRPLRRSNSLRLPVMWHDFF
jgi:hypothetical protein